jgi:eukaryotic-like serine/threonine-protein kinase
LAQRYQLERHLAQGGMAEVWLATDLQLTRQVAVKLLKPSLAADTVIAERFRREAIAAAKLTHPNIVAIYDTVDEGGRQAVVMQYVPGRSLREILDEERKLPVEMTIRIGMATAAALDAAHQSGLVHRDVKPGNILVTPENRVLLTDFGIAKALTESEPNGDLTSDNVMMGTAKYLSPEQVRGRRLDGRADLYALGLVLYECLAGRVPFREDTDAATALARLQRDPTPLGRLRPTLPQGLIELIHRLLARNPDDRPASGVAVQMTLNRILTQGDDLSGGAMRTPAHGTTPPRGTTPARASTPPRGGAPVRTPAGVGARSSEHDATSRTPPVIRTGTHTGARVGPAPGRSASPVHRDPTPRSGVAARGRPNKQFQQRWSPSLVVVGGLLIAALLIGAIIWQNATADNAGPASPDVTAAVPTAESTPTTSPAPTGPATLNASAITSYDPGSRDDPTENDDQLSNIVDESTGTEWRTVCYQDEWMGEKGGVGVVFPLTGPDTGQLDVTFGAAPWAAQIYVADGIPADLSGWTQVDKAASPQELQETFELGAQPHTHILVWFKQLTKGDPCSNKFPWRGSIAEVSYRSSTA